MKGKGNDVSSLLRTITILLTALLIAGCAGSAPPVEGQDENTPGAKSGPILPWSSGDLRIGYIRSDEISQKYADYRDADNQLKSENREWVKESEKLEKNISELESEMDELGLILSPERQKELEKKITDARREMQKFRQQTWYDENSTYVKRRREIMEPIDARVNDAIWVVAEMENMDMIFDTVAGNIVYVKPAFDLTEKVLEELEN